MKKAIVMLLAFGILWLALPNFAPAQKPDTVIVPNILGGNPLGAINRFILGDTTPTGQRVNPNRVYKLERGKIYFFDSRMDVDFPLTLIADDDNPSNPTPPPILARGILQDGTSPDVLIRILKGNGYFKNLYFMAIRPDRSPEGWTSPIEIRADSARFVFEKCVFDSWAWGCIGKYANWPKIYIRDCHFRNNMHPTAWFGGWSWLTDPTPTDTIVMTNNTQFNSGSYFFCPNREITNYALLDHNTIFTNHVNIFYAPYVSNAIYKNNILFGVCAMGQRNVEIEGGWFDWDKEISAIVSIDTIPPDIAARAGVTESSRRVWFLNNAYYWPQKMKDFWAAADTLTPPLWINNRTQAMLNDKAHYPNLRVEGNLEADPGFNSEVMAMVDSLLKYCRLLRTGTQTDYRHYYDPDHDLFLVQWPLPEDLRYSNTALLTAGTDGLPLGDLNWYPDKKALWVTKVQESGEPAVGLPKDYSLSQNFPNPFNPITRIY
ncbi:MAG: hypothetical protein ONB23_11600, partial [candidate division KSB1 bacterium]|nr:hypothetical protein [candidate division KSB1 bacterium]